jgi:hypothetical protein
VIASGHVQRQQLALLIGVYVHGVHVVYQLRQAVGHLSIHLRRLAVARSISDLPWRLD